MSMRNIGMLLALMTMGGVSKGRFTPEPPTPEQLEHMKRQAKNIQQQHQFVINGKTVWARNRKDALKKALTQHCN